MPLLRTVKASEWCLLLSLQINDSQFVVERAVPVFPES